MLPNQGNEKVKLTDIQRVVLRMYAKDPNISLREIARKIIKPNKSMIGAWVQWFEQEGLISRIGNSNKMKVFVTPKGRRSMA